MIRKLDMLNLRKCFGIESNKYHFPRVPVVRREHQRSIIFWSVCIIRNEEGLVHVHVWSTPESFLIETDIVLHNCHASIRHIIMVPLNSIIYAVRLSILRWIDLQEV